MPIIIAIIAVIIVGAGAYFFASQPATPARPTDIAATEETINPADTAPTDIAATEETINPADTAPTDDTISDQEEPTETTITAETENTSDTTIATESSDDTVTLPVTSSVTAIERSVDVSYLTPARTSHELTVSLTVAQGIVTDATIIYDKGDGFSNAHQERFDGAYKAEVIGKPIDSISLSRVGGASLTSGAFNDAVKKIAAQL